MATLQIIFMRTTRYCMLLLLPRCPERADTIKVEAPEGGAGPAGPEERCQRRMEELPRTD